MDRNRGWDRRIVGFLVVLAVLPMGFARAQQLPYDPTRFTRHNWSQIVPDYGYLNGCVTGYRAFVFSDDHYFVFDRRVHGSWRETPQGFLSLTTKSGALPSQLLRLFYGGANTLTPFVPADTPTTVPSNPPSGIFQFRRYDVFQECPQ